MGDPREEGEEEGGGEEEEEEGLREEVVGPFAPAERVVVGDEPGAEANGDEAGREAVADSAGCAAR